MKIPPKRHGAALAAAAAMLLAGCADDADGAGDMEEAAATEHETIEVGLVDFGFEDVPDTVPAGTTFEVRNDADEELHELVAFALPDDEQRTLEELTQLPPEELEAALGRPVSVLLAEPGGPQVTAVGDGTLEEPGRYAFFCFIPMGVDPQVYLEAAADSDGAPQVDGGSPHFTAGMVAEVVVEDPSS